MNLMIDWEMMRQALSAHVESGRSLRSIAEKAGVSRATLLNWLAGPAPETISKGQAVMEALDDATGKGSEG